MKTKIISIVSNQIYYRKKIKKETKEYYVCDFHYDSINNLFVFQDNPEKQKVLQKWIATIPVKYSSFIKNFDNNWEKYVTIFEYEGKRYYLVKSNKPLMFLEDAQYSFIIDSNCDLVLDFDANFSEYLYTDHNVFYLENCDTRICDVYNMEKEKIFTFKINEQMDIFYPKMKTLSDDIIYHATNKSLYLYHIREKTKLVEPNIVSLDNYIDGFIVQSCHLKEKIYMLVQNSTRDLILIYDTNSGKIEANYDYYFAEDIQKIGNAIVVYFHKHTNDFNFMDKSNYSIITLKNDIRNNKTYDVSFQFA